MISEYSAPSREPAENLGEDRCLTFAQLSSLAFPFEKLALFELILHFLSVCVSTSAKSMTSSNHSANKKKD